MTTTAIPFQRARTSELRHAGNDYRIADVVGVHDAAHPGHQVFLVDLLTPSGVIRPHFHEVDQFQVVVSGGGRIGRSPLRRGSVHYTDRHTTYGPIVAGEHGIAFFTVRATPALGSRYMPESKATKGPRGATFSGAVDVHAPLAAPSIRTIGSTKDGAAARQIVLPPGGSSTWQPEEGAGPAFVIVLSGSLKIAATELTERGCAVLDDSGDPVVMEAGHEGTIALELVFPNRAAASAGTSR